MNRYIAIIITLSTLSACSLPETKSRILTIDNNNTRAVTYPGNLRGAYFVDKQSSVRFCSEPAPDIAMENLQKLSANLSATLKSGDQGNAALNAELRAKVIELAGRTELLLVAREMLYRACELSINHDITPEQITKIYDSVSKLIMNLATAEKTQAEANLNTSRSLLLQEEINLQMMKSDK